MIIVQISDTHIEEPGRQAYGRYDTAQSLTRCLAAIQKLDLRPDLVLHTGDVAHSGSPARYAVFRELLSDLPFPFFAIPGNHDARDAFREAFGDQPWMLRQAPF